jgi:UDP-N-acetylmuramoyl-tripeptide--D-alanyl-D-alanine ligase
MPGSEVKSPKQVDKGAGRMNNLKVYEQRFRDFVGTNPILRGLGLIVAGIWRRLMFRTTFIVITGSVGKTTAKDAIAQVLGSHFPTYKTTGSFNHYIGITRNILAVRPWHRYAVIEVGLERPGQMKWFALTTRPDIAVWVNVTRSHTQSFRTLENIAQEKALLVGSLRPGGVAVLNCDNPHIAAYCPPKGVHTIRYGTDSSFDWCASNVSSKWPERLRFFVQGPTGEAVVKTQFVGKHWVPSILPALAIAAEAGLSLKQACTALATLEPMVQRISPANTPVGAIFLRDEWNASIDTLKVAFEVLQEAEARRKIIVFSGMSDSMQNDAKRFRGVGTSAAEIADLAVFVGDRSKYAVKGAVYAGMNPEHVRGFYDLESATEFLRSELREGDLVLLRGLLQDHMSRAYLGMLGEVNCWVATCPKKIACDVCPELKAINESHGR